MRVVVVAVVLMSVTPAARASRHDEHPGWTRSGSVLQFAIPLAGLGLAFLADREPRASATLASGAGIDGIANDFALNWPGPHLEHSLPVDFGISFLRMEVTTYGLKYAFDERRPNGGSHSFPSGHSASAFMGSEFIRRNFGEAYGIPAYVAAAWVGYTRVESHNHYWHDVIAGAVIGIASNVDFDRLQTPWGTASIGADLMPAPRADDGRSTGANQTVGSSGTHAFVPALCVRFDFR